MTSLLDDLLVLRDVLRRSIREADPDKRASLAREYRATLERIETLNTKTEKGDPIDELASRRSARSGSATKGSRRARESGS